MRRVRIALILVLALSSLVGGCAGRYKPTPEGQAMRRGIVLDALGQIGRPYRYGGATPDGFDCSGLVQYVYGLQGLKLPRTAEDQHEQGNTIDLDDAEPGDLLFYRFGWFGIDHVAIYLGDGQAVHAPASGRQVIVAPVAQRWWMDRYVDAVRIIH
ncbi:MAG: NlpC/P60 family protein [Panacagrimonas sp.]|jgi:murein DD-endopeptidase|nr:C40 family peptidase [Panacagrimonas sp.]MCC2657817.1 NlpC/P60 family protein [Panacagrimonas sp.]